MENTEEVKLNEEPDERTENENECEKTTNKANKGRLRWATKVIKLCDKGDQFRKQVKLHLSRVWSVVVVVFSAVNQSPIADQS